MPIPTSHPSVFRRSAGLTLIECLLASVILALIVTAVAQAMAYGQTQTHYALLSQRADNLATALMEEVLSLPYTADGQTTARSSTKLCVADFHNFSESPNALRDAQGQLYPADFQPFSRAVTTTSSTLTLPGLGPTTGLTVTVTVTHTSGQSWQLTRFVPQS